MRIGPHLCIQLHLAVVLHCVFSPLHGCTAKACDPFYGCTVNAYSPLNQTCYDKLTEGGELTLPIDVEGGSGKV